MKEKMMNGILAAITIVLVCFIGCAAGPKPTDELPSTVYKENEKQNLTKNNKYYSVTDVLECGGIKIKSIAECPYKSEQPLRQLECKQKLFIGEKGLDDKIGVTTGWGCIQDRKTSNYYVLIDFFSGGNCWDCAWTNVYNLEGKLIFNTQMDWTKCTLKPRRERTPEGVPDDFASCPEKIIKKWKKNKKVIIKLKQENKDKFRAVNLEEGE